MNLTVAPELDGIVVAVWGTAEPVRVVDRDPRMDEPLQRSAAGMRTANEAADLTTAVRTMYKRVGIDPTKTRPSSEALLRRVRKGDELPRINSLVDVINWCSLETRVPFGLYDLARIDGDVTLRLGRDDEAYAGIRKDTVHVSGRLTLSDAAGPFGNPTSDSARTMVTSATRAALVVVYAPLDTAPAQLTRVLDTTAERLAHICGGREQARWQA